MMLKIQVLSITLLWKDPGFEYNTSLERTFVGEMKSFVETSKSMKILNTISKT